MSRTSTRTRIGVAVAVAGAVAAGCTGGGQGQGGYGGGGGQSPAPPQQSQPAGGGGSGGTGGGEKQVNEAARKDLRAQFAELLGNQPITFEPGTAELTQQGQRSVARVGKMITSSPGELTFVVVGHTAPEPSGTPQEAEQLSTERAKTVADKLKQQGVTDTIRTKGAGDAQGSGPGRHVDIEVQ